jgi:transcriptional regulator with XRE-family HTH domain
LTNGAWDTKLSFMKRQKPLSNSKHPIAVRRRAMKLSGYRLAIKAGISAQHLNAIESGKIQMPRVDVAMRIADALGAKVSELFPEVAA